jgi:hypothetical protein
MVELEGGRLDGPSFQAWRGAWEELDARLEKLRRDDASSFADLMMNQVITVQAEAEQLRESAGALIRVAKSLAKAQKSAKDDDSRQTLLFEQGELSELSNRLMDIAANLD